MLARTGVFAASAVTWIHTPELFPTRVRATGHAVCNSSAQLGSFCAPFLITSGSSLLVGVLLAVLSTVAMLCVLPLPETAGECLDTEHTSAGSGSGSGSRSGSNHARRRNSLKTRDDGSSGPLLRSPLIGASSPS